METDLYEEHTHKVSGETCTLHTWIGRYEELFSPVTEENYHDFATWAKKYLGGGV